MWNYMAMVKFFKLLKKIQVYAIILWEAAAYFQFKSTLPSTGVHPHAFNMKSIYLDPPQYIQFMLQH